MDCICTERKEQFSGDCKEWCKKTTEKVQDRVFLKTQGNDSVRE